MMEKCPKCFREMKFVREERINSKQVKIIFECPGCGYRLELIRNK